MADKKRARKEWEEKVGTRLSTLSAVVKAASQESTLALTEVRAMTARGELSEALNELRDGMKKILGTAPAAMSASMHEHVIAPRLTSTTVDAIIKFKLAYKAYEVKIADLKRANVVITPMPIRSCISESALQILCWLKIDEIGTMDGWRD